MNPLIVFHDNHLLLLGKPAGMLSQEDETGDLDLLSWGKQWIKQTYQKPGNVYLGLLHRLDRPASGLMLLARTSKAASRMSDQFRKRQVKKTYLAMVEGATPKSGDWEDFLLKDNRKSRIAGPKTPGAKHARLTFQTTAVHKGRSLVLINLGTGRAHQIRLQFASRGFPLVGDFRYGAQTSFDGKNLALHACELRIQHPVGKTPITWTLAPPKSWGDAFVQAIQELRLAPPPVGSPW